ncbi:DNA polymerase III subunit alpha [uncultured Subdoligranulum sp.]|uniref:DNA polymerase III subunit alpha n=1 Tax=uncultured Subdoligranulum sp. TaxID=512298 RepID=UPI0032082000
MSETTPRQFTHLHVHTEFSLLDGACRIDRMFDHLKAMGQTACAITDHGVMYGCVAFFDAAKAAGIKPIIGCEVYVATRTRFDKVNRIDGNSHLILLCKNETGYKNLIKMVSAGFLEGFYSKPRIDKDLLEQHHEGLICLSACLAGEVPKAILAGDYERAKNTALYYRDLFGEGNYYIELQDHGLEEDRVVLPQLIRLARETGIPMVATNDAHYITKEDSKMQSILLCIQTGKTIADADRMEFQTDEFYLKSADEMYDLFSMVPEACENTNKIAEQCNFEFTFGETKLPYFHAPDGMENQAYFEKLCWEGLERRYPGKVTDALRERLSYEINVVKKMGYTNYYLIVYDFINYAKSRDIPVGPGRGSGAGSLAAYCVGITDIDPIRYSLIFERFLNPERVSMPDFDVDFCYERRQEVIDYVNEKYGRDHVAQIVTFGTMAARAAVRDVGRVMGMAYQDVDKVAKLIPMELKMTLQKALEVSPDLKTMYEADPQVHELIDTSLKVEGMPRHASTHAAGVVITREPATEYVPLSTNDGLPVTQFNMVEIERLGLLKMDFLGLRTLTVIHDTETAVRRKVPDFRMANISYDDPETYAMLAKGETEGIFQLESTGMTQVLVSMRPRNLEDIIALISLYRPGPMDSIPTYLRNRREPGKISYKTPQLAHILDVTNGCIVYQEQVMQIFRELAGFSFGQADNIRRAMSKKKHKVMEAEREHFVHGCTEPGKECAGCVKNGIPEDVANEIYDEMISFASYAFNKSHAACYAYVAFQTAYLKCHYPHEFMAALLTSVLDNTSKVIEYTTECQRLGIKVLQPDINVSRGGFTADGDCIRFGLNAVKSVGRNLIEAVVKERQERPYRGLYDFCRRMYGNELNRRALENLIKCGAFDTLEPSRRAMLECVEGILKSVETDMRQNLEGQMDLFGMMNGESQEPAINDYKVPPMQEYPTSDLLKMEKEVSGLYLSGHPLDAYREQIAKISTCTIAQLQGDDAKQFDNQNVTILCTVVKNKVMTTKSNTLMAFTTIEDLTGTMELLVFPRVLAECRAALQENAVVVAYGRVSVKEEEAARLIVEGVQPIETYDPNKSFGRNRVDRVQKETRGEGVAGYFLTVPARDCAEMHRVENLLCNIFDGGTVKVYFLFADTGKKAWARHMAVKDDPLLRAELVRILGPEHVKVQGMDQHAK